MEDDEKIYQQVTDSYFDKTSNFKLSNELNLKNEAKFKDTFQAMNKTDDKKTRVKVKRESKSKALFIEAHFEENLPKGWKKIVVQRTTGATAGKYDVFFNTPSGRKLRSKNEILDYSNKNNLGLDLKNFAFSRPKKIGLENATPKKKKSIKNPSMKIDNTSSFNENLETSNTLDSQTSNVSDDSNFLEITASNSELTTVPQESNCLLSILETHIGADSNNENKEGNFSEKKSPIPSSNIFTASENSLLDLHLDICEENIGKSFKIERPISFSFF